MKVEGWRLHNDGDDDVGADVEAAFSNNLTKFSLRPSPKPEKLFPNNCNEVVLSTVPSVIVVTTDPSVLLIVYAICNYLAPSYYYIDYACFIRIVRFQCFSYDTSCWWVL